MMETRPIMLDLFMTPAEPGVTSASAVVVELVDSNRVVVAVWVAVVDTITVVGTVTLLVKVTAGSV